MYRKWKPNVVFIKESQDLKSLYMSTFFRKVTDLEHELNRLKASEENVKRKEKVKEEKRIIYFKASTSRSQVAEDEDNTDEYSWNKEETCLFGRCYN